MTSKIIVVFKFIITITPISLQNSYWVQSGYFENIDSFCISFGGGGVNYY